MYGKVLYLGQEKTPILIILFNHPFSCETLFFYSNGLCFSEIVYSLHLNLPTPICHTLTSDL